MRITRQIDRQNGPTAPPEGIRPNNRRERRRSFFDEETSRRFAIMQEERVLGKSIVDGEQVDPLRSGDHGRKSANHFPVTIGCGASAEYG